jgi:hypothetical protein
MFLLFALVINVELTGGGYTGFGRITRRFRRFPKIAELKNHSGPKILWGWSEFLRDSM